MAERRVYNGGMMSAPAGRIAVILPFIFMILFSGCVTQDNTWSMTINGDQDAIINESVYNKMINCSSTYDCIKGIPLEIFLYYYGIYPVESVSFADKTYLWEDVAYVSAKDIEMMVLPNGTVFYDGAITQTDHINVDVSDLPPVSTLSIAPSILDALGIEDTEGSIIENKTDRIVLFYIDGMGYGRYLNASSEGIINNITAMGPPIKAIDVYPSISRANSRAMVTGIAPDITKGDLKSSMPDGVTILHKVSDNGLKAVWVGGISSPVYLDDHIVYNLDSNANGSQDDEVAEEAIRQYESGADLMIVHFKNTDSVMHDYGPESAEAREALSYADALAGNIIHHLDPGTVVIIFSDHGGHYTEEGGNHGTLLPEDMIVPIFVHTI
ncbi:hypothetical protein CUJ83_03375 [Methanocella sp. CWC-04]|uniref:Metalloenzyme domain-containing protein n=1 Tax=Methanooceanicella nereidis TaxID=2052831 RepID=A0AAP2RCD9_9EURY|nr:alkaline phosphatase family protein [Methanocella sp. CWC-04]MCD1294035.1 hypothetical protein [Methanocella sp. CWC-04]